MPQQPHGDHGVTGPTHWLLDEELASLGSRRRTGTPAALRHEAVEVSVPTATEVVAEPPRRNFLVLVAGLVTALLVYALLSSSAVVGALEEVYPGTGSDSIRIGATTEGPGARELAELRALLAATPGATVERPTAPSSSGMPKAPSGSSPGPDDRVTPPPPPPPPPIVPELPLPEVPGVEVPPLPRLEAPELAAPELPLPEVPELP